MSSWSEGKGMWAEFFKVKWVEYEGWRRGPNQGSFVCFCFGCLEGLCKRNGRFSNIDNELLHEGRFGDFRWVFPADSWSLLSRIQTISPLPSLPISLGERKLVFSLPCLFAFQESLGSYWVRNKLTLFTLALDKDISCGHHREILCTRYLSSRGFLKNCKM